MNTVLVKSAKVICLSVILIFFLAQVSMAESEDGSLSIRIDDELINQLSIDLIATTVNRVHTMVGDVDDSTSKREILIMLQRLELIELVNSRVSHKSSLVTNNVVSIFDSLEKGNYDIRSDADLIEELAVYFVGFGYHLNLFMPGPIFIPAQVSAMSTHPHALELIFGDTPSISKNAVYIYNHEGQAAGHQGLSLPVVNLAQLENMVYAVGESLKDTADIVHINELAHYILQQKLGFVKGNSSEINWSDMNQFAVYGASLKTDNEVHEFISDTASILHNASAMRLQIWNIVSALMKANNRDKNRSSDSYEYTQRFLKGLISACFTKSGIRDSFKTAVENYAKITAGGVGLNDYESDYFKQVETRRIFGQLSDEDIEFIQGEYLRIAKLMIGEIKHFSHVP